MGVYERGNKLWIDYVDAHGERQWKPTGLPVGQEVTAKKALGIILEKVRAEKELLAADAGTERLPDNGVTVGMYGRAWHKRRLTERPQAAKEDKWKLTGHIYPPLENVALTEFRPRHARAFVMELKNKRLKDGSLALAPRTIRSIWSTLHSMFHDAVVDELVPHNPCVLKRGDLPPNADADPEWRAGAVFERREVEQLISEPRIPQWRRTLNGLLFLAGFRPSEAFALRWKHYDVTTEPLGRLDLMRAFNTRENAEKGTKTGKRRLVPVHPTLAGLLAQWKLSGWEEHIGRKPGPDDLLICNPKGAHLRVDDALDDMLADEEMLGLRRRRLYDSRRTFISLAQADGGSRELLRWMTHGPRSGEVLDLYTSIPWQAICAEVQKLRVSLVGGTLVHLRRASGTSIRDSERDSETSGGEIMNDFLSRHPDLNRRPTDYEAVISSGTTSNLADIHQVSRGHATPALRGEPSPISTTVTLSQITSALRRVSAAWEASHDIDELRQGLAAIASHLEVES